MRSTPVLLLSLPLLACAAAPAAPPAPVVSLPVASAVPPAPPPLPPEPAGLTPLPAPASGCSVTGSLEHTPAPLGLPGQAAFGEISDVTATVTFFGPATAFVEGRSSAWTLRGALSPTSARVHAPGWTSFGGVLFAGMRDRLVVLRVQDSTVTLVAPEVRGLTLAEAARTVDVPCGAVSLSDDDVDARPYGDAPPPFVSGKTGKVMALKRGARVSLSADVRGAAVATIDADAAWSVTLLERRGARARIRRGHVAGWIDGAFLAPRAPGPSWGVMGPRDPPMLDHGAALQAAAQFGMIGLLGSGPPSPPRPTRPVEASLTCAADVRLVLEVAAAEPSAPAARHVVGSIPAGRPIWITARGPELTEVAVDDEQFTPEASCRLVVPSRDLATGCTPGTASPPAPRSDGPDTLTYELPDGIEMLDREGGSSGPRPRVGNIRGP